MICYQHTDALDYLIIIHFRCILVDYLTYILSYLTKMAKINPFNVAHYLLQILADDLMELTSELTSSEKDLAIFVKGLVTIDSVILERFYTFKNWNFR